VRYQLARCYQFTGEPEKAESALRDYEQFRKAQAETAAEAETPPPITPPR
jgi:hypothetical protein